ncbi:ABC transporter substrate-binding protein [Arthrobacter woluwensis]|uniref:Iron complex transport system substrate-binding protein n=1 Tax=Arthrobacter woluwensis TaxID=156980 RepID=A0A1H4P971_9MICC|nr:ABC transporter substrate-binding protein [Arthrobacter woluwensis]SEC03980.1 iron complex transport system substrate-binding protein [Arthrobacter woluwensis]
MRSRSTFLPAVAASALTLGLVLSGCAAPSGSAGGSSSSSTADATRVVTTDQGEVRIPANPRKVVVLNYALAGYLYDLDVPVAAMIPEDADQKGKLSDFWAEDAKADGTTFLPWSTDGFDMEAILALKPDLIVAGGIGFPLMQATKAYDQLSKIAPTVIVSGKKTEWKDQYSFLAKDVFGKDKVYEDALAAYEKKAAEVKKSITVPQGESVFVSFTADQTPYVGIETRGLPRVFTDLGFTPAPLFATGRYQPYTAGGDSFKLSTEQVGQVLTQPTLFATGFNGAPVDVATLSKNAVYAKLPAFKNGQAFDLPYWTNRADYDETMALLDLVKDKFTK